MKFNALKTIKKTSFMKIFSLAFVALAIVSVAGTKYWYKTALQPVDKNSGQYSEFVIEKGQSVTDIANNLENEELIRSSRAFTWYIKGDLAGISLLAGKYTLSPSMSVPIIANILSEGHVDAYMVTLLPGNWLGETRQELISAGWSAEEVDRALGAEYDHPLLKNRPEGATLEGYIFPDTYEINDETTPEELITRTLDNFYQKIEERDLENKLKAQGLNLFEGITLASIVEKESGKEEDKPKIAQVFLKRLNEGMILGSDVTFYYAAESLGVDPSVDLDSPYNTRLYSGLPPGPISNFVISSLEAVANPAKGDYLYFVAGDDGNTYFSRTLEEHRALTAKYCIELCKIQ